MTDQVDFLDPTLALPAEELKTPQQRLANVSGNSGNIVFSECIPRLVPGARSIPFWNTLEGRSGTLLLALANVLNTTHSLDPLCENILRSSYEKVVCLSVGLQAYSGKDVTGISPSAERLLRIIADRSASIGVRGEYTAELLYRLGFKNIDVVGCPSLASWEEGLTSQHRRKAGFWCHVNFLGIYRDKVAEFLRYVAAQEGHFIEQSQIGIMDFDNKNIPLSSGSIISYYTANDELRPAISACLRKASKPLSQAAWEAAFRKPLRFSIGTRFHASVAALQRGIPALVFETDLRVKEMCEYYNIPCLPFSDFDERVPLVEYEKMADTTLFKKTIRDRQFDFRSFLKRNGLKDDAAADENSGNCTFLSDHSTSARANSINRYLSDIAQHSMAIEPAQIKVRSDDLRSEGFGTAVDRVVPCNNFSDYAELKLQAASAITILSPQVDDIQVSYRRNANLIGQEYRNEFYPSASSVYGVVSRYINGTVQATILDIGCAPEQLLHEPFVGHVGISVDRRTLIRELRSTAKPDPVLNSLHGFRERDIDLVVCARVLEEAPDPRALLEALRRIGAKAYFFVASARELVIQDGGLDGLGPPAQSSKVREWSCLEFRRFISRFFRVDEHLVIDVSNATQLVTCTG